MIKTEQIVTYVIGGVLGTSVIGLGADAIHKRMKLNRLEQKIATTSQVSLDTKVDCLLNTQDENQGKQQNEAPSTLGNWITSTNQRVAAVEQSIREFTERQSQNTANDDNNHTEKSQIPNILHTLKCLKYEVKKLKETPQNAQINDNDSQSSALNEFSERLQSLERQVERLVEANQNNTNDQPQNENIEQMRGQIGEIVNSIRCLKYEMKKIITEGDKNKTDLKCVKYEVKKLKNAQAEKKGEICEIEAGDSQMVQPAQISELKSELEKLAQQVQSINQVIGDSKLGSLDMAEHLENTQNVTNQLTQYASQLESVSQTLDQSKVDEILRCIKYELKQLKQKVSTIEDAQSSAQPQTNNEELSQFKTQINTLQNSVERLTADGKCLKYEVRKLKEQSTFDPTSLTQIQKQLEDNASQDAAESTELKSQLSSMEESLRCMKYELKKLKEAPKGSANVSSSVGVDAFEQKISDLESQYKKLQLAVDKQTSDTHCLKYEVKQLKERPLAVSPISNEQSAQETTSGSVKSVETSISALNDGADAVDRKVLDLQSQIDKLKNQLKQQAEKLNQQNEQNQNVRSELQIQETQTLDQIPPSNDVSQLSANNTVQESESNQQVNSEKSQKDSLFSSSQVQTSIPTEQVNKASQAPVTEASQQPEPPKEQLNPAENQVSTQSDANGTSIQNSGDQSHQEQPLTQGESPIKVNPSETGSSKQNEQNSENQKETKEQSKELEQQKMGDQTESNETEQKESEIQNENNDKKLEAEQHQRNDDQKQEGSQNPENGK